MTRTTRYWLSTAAAGGVVFMIGSACETKTVLVPVPVMSGALADGGRADIVEREAERYAAPPASLRGSAGDTVIVARKTPVLSKKIDLLTDTELVNYLNSLAYKTGGYNTQSANVPCTGPMCTGSDSAHVFIQPESGMNKWERDSIPANGVIVARIINDARAGRDAAVYGFPAQRKTWWVVDDSSGTRRSRFFIRTYSATGAAIQFVTHPWPFTRCLHADAPLGRAARAKFWTCAESAADTSLVIRKNGRRSGVEVGSLQSYIHPVSLRSAVPLTAESPPFLLQTNWVSCGSGCCATM